MSTLVYIGPGVDFTPLIVGGNNKYKFDRFKYSEKKNMKPLTLKEYNDIKFYKFSYHFDNRRW